MNHTDPELLDDIGLLRVQPTPDVSAHLADCAQCRAHVDQVRALHAAAVDAPRSLPEPPASVWAGIQAALDTEPTTIHRPARALQWSRMVQMVAAGVVLGLIGGFLLWGTHESADPKPGTQVVELASGGLGTPEHPDQGRATMVRTGDSVTLTIALRSVPQGAGTLAAWLVNEDTTRAYPLGQLGVADNSFTLPMKVLREGYRTVEITRQAKGAQPAVVMRGRIGAFRATTRATRPAVPQRSTSPTPRPTNTPTTPASTTPRPTATPTPTPTTTPSPTKLPSITPSPTAVPSSSPSASATASASAKPTRKERLRACRALLRSGAGDPAERKRCKRLLRRGEVTPSPSAVTLSPTLNPTLGPTLGPPLSQLSTPSPTGRSEAPAE